MKTPGIQEAGQSTERALTERPSFHPAPTLLQRLTVGRVAAVALILASGVLGTRMLRRHDAPTDVAQVRRVAPPARQQKRLHSRPIIERDGRTLLWARGDPDSPDAEWFDVTDSRINPDRFQYGIGKDSIPSIDDPVFVKADDPRLLEAGILDDALIIGFAFGSEARAYPLHILNRHELVNDRVGGKPVTVGW